MVGDYQTKQGSLRPQSLTAWHSRIKLGHSSLLMCTIMYYIIKQSKTKPSQSTLNEHSLKTVIPTFSIRTSDIKPEFCKKD